MSSPEMNFDAPPSEPKPTWRRGFLTGLIKFTATGLLSFGASAAYTSYRFEATRNVAVVPVQVEVVSECTVDMSKLTGYVDQLREEAAGLAVKAVKEATAGEPEASPALAKTVLSRIGELVPQARSIQKKLDYLDTLAMSADAGEKVHARRDALEPYIDTFRQYGAVACDKQSSLSVDLAILVETPKVYLISGRNCTLAINDNEPVSARVELILAHGATPSSGDVDVFPVSDSTWARATFTEPLDEARGSTISLAAELIRSTGKYTVTVACSRLNRGGMETVGGDRYFFRRGQVEGVAESSLGRVVARLQGT